MNKKIIGVTVGTTMNPQKIASPNEKANAIKHTYSGETIVATDSADAKFEGLRVFGNSEQGENPSPSNPQPIESVGKDGSINIGVYSGNLLPYPYPTNVVSQNGVILTSQADGGIRCSGTPTDYCGFALYSGGIIYDTMTISLLGNAENVMIEFSLYDVNSDLLVTKTCVTGYGFTINKSNYPTATKMTSTLKRSNNNVVMSGIAYPMIVAGDVVPTVYEKYKQVQNLQISTPNGLPGIPLGSIIPDVIASSEKYMSGVYWDEKTQQYYIGDEKDYGSGKYIQRIGSYTFDGTENGNWTVNTNYTNTFFYTVNIRNLAHTPALCDKYIYDKYVTRDKTFMFGTYINIKNSEYATGEELRADLKENPITIQFVLTTPIETDLSSEEIEAYRVLTSNYPTTTIINDENAYMEATLVADTKNYIDNKFAALAAQML